MRSRLWPLFVGGAVLLAWFIWGGGGGAGPVVDPVRAEIGFDPTPTDADRLARLAADDIVLVRPTDRVSIRAADNKTSLITTSRPPDEDAAYQLYSGIVHDSIPVTDLASYFETLADEADRSDSPLILLVYTDGQDDGDPGKVPERIAAAARRLASNPNVRLVALIGLVRDTRPNWPGLPEMLAPLGGRLAVFPLSAPNPDALRHAVEGARPTAPAVGKEGPHEK